MSRSIGAALVTAVEAANVPLLVFVELDFSGGFVRVTNAPYAFDWNGYTWTGLGRLGGIEAVQEGASLEARGVALKLSGVPLSGEGDSENISIALNQNYQGRDAKVWVAPLGGGDSHLLLPGTSGNYASTPDSAAVSVTGDIDIRARIAPNDWTPTDIDTILSKDSANQQSYLFRVNPGGTLNFVWTEDGSTYKNFSSTAATGFTNGTAHSVRVAFDVDNGAGNAILRFYTSEDGETWAQLGADVAVGATTSIFEGTANLQIGAYRGGSALSLPGKVYYAEVRNGIDGEVVAKFDPSRDDLGGLQTWTINKSGSNYARIIRNPFAIISDPKLIFLGRMDNMEIEAGKAATIVLQAESRLADLERPRVLRYNDATQQLLYPGDRGLEFAEAMVERAFKWGSR